jgi:tRNA nucleotidyltransferase (CCA-adding enzyme)
MAEIEHPTVAAFAGDKVNLSPGKAREHHDQVKGLRNRLEKKIAEDPDYALVKMLHAGSVAKGTALKTVNDLDVAVYVESDKAPSEDKNLVPWFADRLHEANPQMERDQFVEEAHCVTVNYRGSGLNVDVVPVLYEGAADDLGYLVNKNNGDRVLTSVTLHLRFIRARKKKYGQNYAELIRITKWWKRSIVKSDPQFKFKSFMIELIWADLADQGVPLDDYPTAIEDFFKFIVTTEFDELIAFTDFCKASELPERGSAAIAVIDPVNVDNNVAVRYSESDKSRIVAAAQEAFDALSEARFATTKGRAVDCWQVILGPTFRG